MATVLVVGGADTGRAPMVAAFLRHHLCAQGYDWQIESAGVLGHDGAPWQSETQLALAHFNISPREHRARSLTPELVATADLLLAVNRGIGKALETHFLHTTLRTLPDLAGTDREVPDPSRMTLDAWIIYGLELENQIKAALPTIIQIVTPQPQALPVSHPAVASSYVLPLERLGILVDSIAEIPEYIDWSRARTAIRETFQATATTIASTPSDLRPAAIAMILSVLGTETTPLTTNQLAFLKNAITVITQPMDSQQLGALAVSIGSWSIG